MSIRSEIKAMRDDGMSYDEIAGVLANGDDTLKEEIADEIKGEEVREHNDFSKAYAAESKAEDAKRLEAALDERPLR